MTKIAEELVEGIQPGDYIRIRYGTDSQQDTSEGTVVKITENFLHLNQKTGGVAKIRLDDSLRSLDAYNEGDVRSGTHSGRNDTEAQGKSTQNTKFQIMRQFVGLTPAIPYNFVFDDWINSVKDLLKKTSNMVIKNAINGVFDSLNVAIKSNSIAYKYHDLRARIHQLWDKCGTDADYDIFYLSLGILSIAARDYEYSLEPLIRAKKYALAAYVASIGGFSDFSKILTFCSLLSKETTDVNQYISEICIANKDVEALKRLLLIYRENNDICEKIASCAFMLFNASGSKLTCDITPYFSAYDSAYQILGEIPNDWKNNSIILECWDEYEQYVYPRASDLTKLPFDEIIVGKIKYFSLEHKNGFITPNHYFYISQVYSDTDKGLLLRKLLAANFWNQLEVRFYLGQSPIYADRSAACGIELTEKGYEDALDRLMTVNISGKTVDGFVEVFFCEHMYGRIQADGRTYKFGIDDIVDPWLRAYYKGCFEPKEQDVRFKISGNRAINICWKDPSLEDREMFINLITENEQKEWEDFLERTEQSTIDISLPEEDPYKKFEYSDLAEWIPEDRNRRNTALTWGGKIPVAETEKRPASRNDASTEKQLSNKIKEYADYARRALQEGNLDAAKYNFEKALKLDEFNESVICDYISLCMRIEGEIDTAIRLLSQYEDMLPKEKLLNLKIQVYDKKKDYVRLCPLYEEAFRTSFSISKKSHTLYRLIDAYVKIGEYEKGVEACKKWETFYNQNRFRTDAEKLKKAEPNIERQKAICFYHIGRIAEAREIATNLLRLNPGDVVANSILGESESSSIELLQINDDDLLDDDITENPESRMPRFVQSKIQQADIATNLKSPNLKDGKYIGSTKEALEDIKKLVSSRRISSKTRYEFLFAACKLFEQIEQREVTDRIPNIYYKYRLAGRAMASWGDYMVSQLNQLDTTRMAYRFSLRILIPTKNGMEQDWINSYNRYIKSFFMAQVGKDSLDDYINQQRNSKTKDGLNTDIFEKSRIPDVLISEFMVGILQLVDALSNQKERQRTFIEELYGRSNDLKESICKQFSVYVDNIPEVMDGANFYKCVIAACDNLNQHVNLLNETLISVGNFLFSGALHSELLNSLDVGNWSAYLTQTDVVRLKRIHYVLKRYQDYFTSVDFENRADCLRATILEIKDLLQGIQNEPTDISYDIYLPTLEQIVLKLIDQQTDLYQNFLPKLSWYETLPPFRTPDGHICVQLTVENELNYQTADMLEVISIQGADILESEKGNVVQSLRGGEESEIGVIIAISETADQTGSFSATIGYSFKCNDSPENIITKNQEVEFTFVIRDESFIQLKNPFSAYEGKVMDNDSMFLGRTTQIQQILKMICPNNDGNMNYGRAIAMYGQTRTGKTSLLYHLKKELEKQYQDNILIWDIGNIASSGFQGDFLYNFLYQLLYIGNKAILENKIFSDLVEEYGLKVPSRQLLENPLCAQTFFNTYMRELNNILKREHKIIVLIIDEFTYLHGYIKEGKISMEFMHFWKGLLQDYCIFAIVAGQDDMLEFMREYQNEFACMEPLKLTYLEEQDAKRLIHEPLERANNRSGLFMTDAPINDIYELTAGSAYLTIILCSKLVNYLNDKGAYMITRGIVKEFLRTRVFGSKSFLSEIYFEAQLQERGHRELDEVNKEILLSIARNSQTTGYANIDEIICEGKTQEEIQSYLDRLVDRNVLVKEGRNYYWIQVKLLEKWLINTMGV